MIWSDIEHILTSNWVLGPGVFILWCAVVFILKSVIFRRLRAMASRTSTEYDNILLNALNMPLNLIILFLGFSLIWKILPMSTSIENFLNIFTKIVVFMSITIFVDHFIVGMLKEHDHRVPDVKLGQGLIQGLIRVVIYMLGVFILLSNIGVNITPLLASLGVGTLAVALALQSTLANFFSGLFIMMDRSIRIGDFVQLETGEKGYVDEIGWRASRIRLLTNNHVIIPNAKLVDSVVTNFYSPKQELYTLLDVGVHYDSDLEHVERVAMEVAREVIKEHDGTIDETEPVLWFNSFADSSINFVLRVACKDFVSTLYVQHELIKRLHRRFDTEGIVIPFPLRTLDFQPRHIELFRELLGSRKA